METGVIFCTVCSSREAQYTCICQFPLPRLCASAECTEIHTGKKSAFFHYFLPTSASDYVTARNHLSIQQRVLALHHTQSRLISSLSLLDTAVLQIEEAYQRQVAALAELKDRYIARVNQLKEAATEAFNYAIGETAQHAANVDYTPQSEIAQWIWTMASKAEIDDIPLFQSEIRETRTEEVEEMLTLKVTPIFQSLTPWSMNFSTDIRARNREELGKLTMKIEALEHRARTSEDIIRALSEEVKNCQKESEQLMTETLDKINASSRPATITKPKPISQSLNQAKKSADDIALATPHSANPSNPPPPAELPKGTPAINVAARMGKRY